MKKVDNGIVVFKIITSSTEGDAVPSPASISHSLHIDSTGLKEVFIRGRRVAIDECNAFKCPTISLPKVNERNFVPFLRYVDGLSICTGNPDNHFLLMAKEKKGTVLQTSIIDNLSSNATQRSGTLRSKTCQMLIAKDKTGKSSLHRCKSCITLRNLLRVYYNIILAVNVAKVHCKAASFNLILFSLGINITCNAPIKSNVNINPNIFLSLIA